MTTKSAAGQKTEREGNVLFLTMKIAAWVALIVGGFLCISNYEDFSDSKQAINGWNRFSGGQRVHLHDWHGDQPRT